MRTIQRQEKYLSNFSKVFFWLKIGLSFFLAFVYSVYIASNLWQLFRFEVALILLLFWHHRRPQQVGLMVAWFVGLLSDVISGNSLGVNAFLYIFAIYIVQLFGNRFRLNTLVVQFFYVAFISVIIGTGRLFLLDASSLIISTYQLILILQALVSALFWIILVVIYDK